MPCCPPAGRATSVSRSPTVSSFRSRPARHSDGAERIAGIAVPGLPNLHCHAFQRGMAGLAEHRGPAADSFWTWREVMYRFLDRLTPDDVEAIAAFAYMEMLEAGFTARRRIPLSASRSRRPRRTPTSARWRRASPPPRDETGIGLTLLPSFYAYGGFGGAPPAEGQRRFLNDPDRFLRLRRAHAAPLPRPCPARRSASRRTRCGR